MKTEADPMMHAAPEGAGWVPQPTLPGGHYWKPEVWQLERERVFFDEWFAVAREEEFPNAGDFVGREVAGESILLTRGTDGKARAFYNVCTHRGTKLCDDGPGHAKSNVIKCPYHAWTFTMDGECVGTPNVHEEEGFDKKDATLHTIAVDSFGGFVYVHLGQNPGSLADAINENFQGSQHQYDQYRMQDLRVGKRIIYEVEANWKIVLENFNECLHCPSVHPELVALVPIFKKGKVDEREGWGGNTLANGATTLTSSGTSNRAPLPGLTQEDIGAYFGHNQFPNMMYNFHSDCVMTYRLEPISATHTRIVSEYLFHPDAIAAKDFDPSDIADFWDLVSKQDWEVCERAMIGNRSRAYAKGGVYPFNDRWLMEFNEQYLAKLGDA